MRVAVRVAAVTAAVRVAAVRFGVKVAAVRVAAVAALQCAVCRYDAMHETSRKGG